MKTADLRALLKTAAIPTAPVKGEKLRAGLIRITSRLLVDVQDFGDTVAVYTEETKYGICRRAALPACDHRAVVAGIRSVIATYPA
jgi:hypothetical protein